MTTASAIVWPEKYTPGTTDNFVSNEAIAAGLSAAAVWRYLVAPAHWERYYDNASEIAAPAELSPGADFSFATFGFPPLAARCVECVPPGPGPGRGPGRLAWSADNGDAGDGSIDVYHAWLVEDLPGGRVRVLTQESQIGAPAAELGRQRPSPMLVKHQDWVDGLVAYARERA